MTPLLSNTSPPQKSSLLKIRLFWIIFLICIVVGIFLVWTKWENHRTSTSPHQIPLIMSNGKPFKIRAKDPGGYQILHQDKEIYNRFVKADPALKVTSEHISPPPEEPIFIKEDLSSQEIPLKKGDTIYLESLHSSSIKPHSSASPIEMEEEEEQNKSWTNIFENLIENGIDTNDHPNFPPLIYRVQLAILKNKEEAHAEWHRLSVKYKHLLQNLSMLILSDVKSDGSLRFYIQVGDFAHPKEAESLCHILKQNNVSCLVTSQKGD